MGEGRSESGQWRLLVINVPKRLLHYQKGLLWCHMHSSMEMMNLPGISVSRQVEHKQFIGNGNSSAHRLGERYFFALMCNRTGFRIF
jgi:hypothetical protein